MLNQEEWEIIADCFNELAKKAPPTISPTEIQSVKEQSKELKNANNEGRGEDKKVTAEDKAKIANYALKNGVSAAIRHFKHTGTVTDRQIIIWIDEAVGAR